jgi:hypothetical protein
MALNAAIQQYAASVEHGFSLSLQCTSNTTGGPVGNGTTCPQDGDTIETTIHVTPQAGAPSVPSSSKVQIVTKVEAVPMCERTKPTVRILANTELDSILRDAPLSVELFAMDIDNQPIRFSRADLALTWDGDAVPFNWRSGVNKYTWNIPPDRDGGDHEIVVMLNGSGCILLRRTVTVASDRMQLIVAGSIGGAAILVLAVLGFLVWKNKSQAKELIFSLLSYEGILTGELCIEAW